MVAPHLLSYSTKTLIASSSTIAGSPGTITITDLDQDYTELQVILEGISHDDGSNRYFTLKASMDNGSTYPLEIAVSPVTSAAGTLHCAARIYNYSQAALTKYMMTDGGGFNNSQPGYDSDATADTVDAIQVGVNSGNIDAGTVYVFASR